MLESLKEGMAEHNERLQKGIIYLTPETPSGRYLLVMGITLWF